jgi:hypothetical protein
VYTADDCDDGDPCTDDTCDATSGCTSEEVDCSDGDDCTTNTCTASFTCAEGTEYAGSCYVARAEALLWPDAKAACEALGGHLATIADADENLVVLASALAVCGDRAWIGLSDTDDEGAFGSNCFVCEAEPTGAGWTASARPAGTASASRAPRAGRASRTPASMVTAWTSAAVTPS